MVPSNNQVEPWVVARPTNKFKCWSLTLKDCLTLLVGTAIPVVIAVYTAVTNEQMQKSAKFTAEEQQRIANERREFDLRQAAELYQQQLYKNFLDDMYILHKDGELNDLVDPWVFANARYRAAHRLWDATRKAQVLQFLKEKQLIGRQNHTNGCERKNIKDIIRLNGLDFDRVKLTSVTGGFSQIDLSFVEFNQVSMINATFSHVNLDGATFIDSRLDGGKFNKVSLKCVTFNGTILDGMDFGDSNLDSAQFLNVDLSTTKLGVGQIQQAIFENVIMPNGIKYTSKITTKPTMINEITTISAISSASMKTATSVFTTSEPTEQKNISITITTTISSTCPKIRWNQTSVTIAGTGEYGGATNQFFKPSGLYVDNDQSILIADYNNDRIVEWKFGATSGQIVAGGNGVGRELDQFNGPTYLVIEKQANVLIVCDYGNNRIMQWARQGGTKGDVIIQSIACHSLATHSQGYFYTADLNGHVVLRFKVGNKNGTVVAGGYGAGDRLSQLNQPTHIFVDESQTVYVMDSYNNRVMKWMQGAREGTVLVAPGRLEAKGRLFVDPMGTLSVCQEATDRLWRICPGEKQGNFIFPESGQLVIRAGDISFDRAGNLYITDMVNHQVLRFTAYTT